MFKIEKHKTKKIIFFMDIFNLVVGFYLLVHFFKEEIWVPFFFLLFTVTISYFKISEKIFAKRGK